MILRESSLVHSVTYQLHSWMDSETHLYVHQSSCYRSSQQCDGAGPGTPLGEALPEPRSSQHSTFKHWWIAVSFDCVNESVREGKNDNSYLSLRIWYKYLLLWSCLLPFKPDLTSLFSILSLKLITIFIGALHTFYCNNQFTDTSKKYVF